MRTFIIIAFLLFIAVNTTQAHTIGHLRNILNMLQDDYLFKHVTYGNDDDNYNNYNNDDNNNNYNSDDDNYSNNNDDNYNNNDDNYSSGDDDDHYSNDDDDSSEIPLDGGLSFLAVAGAGLGIKKLRDNRAKKKAEHNEE